jgi:hypothetical protein
MMNNEGRARLAEAAEAAGILREMQEGAEQLGARLQGGVVACTGAPVTYKPEVQPTPRGRATKAGTKKSP